MAASWACCPIRCTASLLRSRCMSRAGISSTRCRIASRSAGTTPYSIKAKHPKELRITATTADGVIWRSSMRAYQWQVQFHPESIMTNTDVGLKMLSNAITGCATDNNMKKKRRLSMGGTGARLYERRDD